MKRRQAILLLEGQIEKLKNTNADSFSSWRIHTSSLIKDFLGENSDEYKEAKELTFVTHYYDPHDALTWRLQQPTSSTKNTDKNIQFINNCIEKIRLFGLYRQPRRNWASNMGNGTFVTIAIFILGGIGTGSFCLGKYVSDVQNIDLKNQLKAKVDDTQKSRLDMLNHNLEQYGVMVDNNYNVLKSKPVIHDIDNHGIQSNNQNGGQTAGKIDNYRK